MVLDRSWIGRFGMDNRVNHSRGRGERIDAWAWERGLAGERVWFGIVEKRQVRRAVVVNVIIAVCNTSQILYIKSFGE